MAEYIIMVFTMTSDKWFQIWRNDFNDSKRHTNHPTPSVL